MVARGSVLCEVDLASLGTVRQVNSHFRAAVDSLSSLRTLRKHAADTLRVIYTLTSNVASFFSLSQLWAEFTHPTCRAPGCPKFGLFVFLPTLRRCCHYCLTHRREFQVFSISRACAYFGVTRHAIVSRSNLPVVHRPRGMYGDPWMYVRYPGHQDLVSVKQAEGLGTQRYGSRPAMIEAVDVKCADKRAQYQCKLKEWHRRYRQGVVARRPPVPAWMPPLTNDSLWGWRCQGATDLPFFDLRMQQSPDTGVYCSACTLRSKEEMVDNDYYYANDDDDIAAASDKHRIRRNRAFTLGSIQRHFDHCWRQSGHKLGDNGSLVLAYECTPDFLIDEVEVQ